MAMLAATVIKDGVAKAAASGDVSQAETFDATIGFTKSGETFTPTGSTSTAFQIDSDNTGPKFKNSTGDLQIRNAADSAYANIDALALKIAGASMVDANGAAKVQSAVAGDGLVHSAGVLSVNPDGSTLEISSDALRIKASGVTAVKLENAVADAILTATLTVDNEGDTVSDTIRATVQVKDVQGNALAQRCLVQWWISDTQWSTTAAVSYPTVAHNDGQSLESLESGVKFRSITDATGKLAINITQSGDVTYYFQAIVNGIVYSVALDFD